MPRQNDRYGTLPVNVTRMLRVYGALCLELAARRKAATTNDEIDFLKAAAGPPAAALRSEVATPASGCSMEVEFDVRNFGGVGAVMWPSWLVRRSRVDVHGAGRKWSFTKVIE